MKTKYTLFVICCVLCFSITAQWKWAKNISIKQWDNGKYMAPSASGHMFVAGDAGYFSSAASDIFIREYDITGNLISAFTDTGCSIYDFAIDTYENTYALVNAGNNISIRKYNFTGMRLWNIPGKLSAIATHQNFLYASAQRDTIFKFDLNGNLLSTIISPSAVHIHKIKTDNQGSVIITGAKLFDAYIAKYDSSGNFLWEFYSGGTSHNPAVIESVDIDAYNNIYFTGYHFSDMKFATGSLIPPSGRYGHYLAKFNTQGQCVWTNSQGGRSVAVNLDGVYSGSHDTIRHYDFTGQLIQKINCPLSVNPLSKTDHGIYFTGIFKDTIVLGTVKLMSIVATDGYIVKYNTSRSTKGPVLTNTTSMDLFPIPPSGILTVHSQKSAPVTKICVYDMLGNCILNQPTAMGDKYEIDLSAKRKGVYFLEINSGEEKAVSKIVLE